MFVTRDARHESPGIEARENLDRPSPRLAAKSRTRRMTVRLATTALAAYD